MPPKRGVFRLPGRILVGRVPADEGRQPVAQAANEASFSYDALPDELLTLILELAGQEAGRSIVGVCKRWERFYFSLWHSFDLAPGGRFPRRVPEGRARAWFAEQHGRLSRVASLVEGFSAGGSLLEEEVIRLAGRRAGFQHSLGRAYTLADFVELLQPTVLRKATLWWDTGESNMEQLARFTRLQSLLLCGGGGCDLPSRARELWRQLPALQDLELHSRDLCKAEWEAVLALTQLTRLSLHLFCVATATFVGGGPQLLARLPRLPHLRELQLVHRPALFPVEREELYHEGFGALLFPRPASFPALRKYRLSLQLHDWYSWRFQIDGAEMASCWYEALPNSGGKLSCTRVAMETGLPQLLAAVVPQGQPLTEFKFIDATGDEVALELALELSGAASSTALSNLRSLSFVYPSLTSRALKLLLKQAPQLTALALNECRLERVPNALRSYQGLQRLELLGCRLAALPEGRYLESVEWLDLSKNKFEKLPMGRSLAKAAALRRLDVSNNRWLRLDAAGINTLARLPSLQIFILDAVGGGPEVQEALSALPGVTHFDSWQQCSPRRAAEQASVWDCKLERFRLALNPKPYYDDEEEEEEETDREEEEEKKFSDEDDERFGIF